jgi:hypothetical protein
MADTKPESDTKPYTKTCNKCQCDVDVELFRKGRNTCKKCEIQLRIQHRKNNVDAENERRRKYYANNEEVRKKAIENATQFKQKKILKKREEFIEKIGIGNKLCKYCDTIKEESHFRHNRVKCKNCENQEPLAKFKRNVRVRIYKALKGNKPKHTIEYLGCSSIEYNKYIMNYDEKYNMQNYGPTWHIDHVIPLALFNLDDEEQQKIAFNWRNTMPLGVLENRRKNKHIIKSQISAHFEFLKSYHETNNITLPQNIIDLYATHLDAGNSLEPLLPLCDGNITEEHG